MPIKVPEKLPAISHLVKEGIIPITEKAATRQDIRPLRIGLLNLMPNKQETEIQILRLLGATSLQIEMTLVSMSCYTPRNISIEYMQNFYRQWNQVSQEKFDGFIVTGAPVEHLPFEDVFYWKELMSIMDWTRKHVHSTIFICWGAQASCYYFYGIPKDNLQEKAFGCARHIISSNTQNSPFLRGFSDNISLPVSRRSESSSESILKSHLHVLLENELSKSPSILYDPQYMSLYMFDHIEYDTMSLDKEYKRDIALGKKIVPPFNYYENNDPSNQPINTWRAHAHLLFANWINEVYQTVPYDINEIGLKRR